MAAQTIIQKMHEIKIILFKKLTKMGSSSQLGILGRLFALILLAIFLLVLLVKLPPNHSAPIFDVQGVFLKESPDPSRVNTLQPHNWSTIAELLASYGINMVVVEAANLDAFFGEEQLPYLIEAFHGERIAVHVLMQAPAMTSNSSLWTVNHLKQTMHPSGDPLRAWTCPTNPGSKLQALRIVADILNYDIDGFMFDYIRYDETRDMCFCNHCKIAFEQWLGTSITENEWTTYYYNEAGAQQRLDWRQIPVNEWVRDVSQYIKSEKPNVQVSAAVFTGSASWDPKITIGQDGALWVQNGWLDFVAPMIYIEYPPMYMNIDAFRTAVQWCRNRYAPNHEKPMIVWIENKIEQALSISLFTETVQVLKEEAAEGFIIFKYGGPDWTDWIDIRPYLEVLQPSSSLNITSITQTPLSSNVLPTDEVKVNVTVTENTSTIKQVSLTYVHTNGSGTWSQTVNMTNIEGIIWNATIPALPFGTNVTYTIKAGDNASNIVNSEDLGYECQYRVIPELNTLIPWFLLLSSSVALVYKILQARVKKVEKQGKKFSARAFVSHKNSAEKIIVSEAWSGKHFEDKLHRHFRMHNHIDQPHRTLVFNHTHSPK